MTICAKLFPNRYIIKFILFFNVSHIYVYIYTYIKISTMKKLAPLPGHHVYQ